VEKIYLQLLFTNDVKYWTLKIQNSSVSQISPRPLKSHLCICLEKHHYSVKHNAISSAQLENFALDITLGRYFDYDSKTIQKESVDEISTLY